MQLGMVGLGRMGANIVRRLMRDGHDVRRLRRQRRRRQAARRRGRDRRRVARRLRREADAAPRAVWVMVPAGEITEKTVASSRLSSSPATRSSTAATPTTATTSAAPRSSRERGHRLRRLRDERRRLRPRARLLPDDRRPRRGVRARSSRSSRRSRRASTPPSARPGAAASRRPAEQGYLHCGPSGAGHFVKMVHNGIEYGIMAAYAEGLNILRNADVGEHEREADAETAPLEHPESYQYDIDIPEVAEVWRRGSVDRLVAARPHRGGAGRVAGPRGVRGPRLGLGRGPLDVDRRDRGGRARAGPDARRSTRASPRAASTTSPTRCSRRCASSSAATRRSSG